METETKRKGKALTIVIVVILMLGLGVGSFYVGKNYDSIFLAKASKEEKTAEKEEVDINSNLVQTLYEKYRDLTELRCESEAFTLDTTTKRILALKNIPISELENLTLSDAESNFKGDSNYEHEEGDLNFKYSSKALHDSYILLFGSDDDLVDESFAGTVEQINTYNANLKMYANHSFIGGCTGMGIYSDELTSAEKKGNKLTLYSKVSYTPEYVPLESIPSQYKGFDGDYQYDFVLDEKIGNYVLKDFKKIS